MTSVLNSIIKLPRYVRILATNGIDENNAIVDNDNDKDKKQAKYSRTYYIKNRDLILEKKKVLNSQPHIKKRNAEYHKKWYQSKKAQNKST